jgi:hypothetical protein
MPLGIVFTDNAATEDKFTAGPGFERLLGGVTKNDPGNFG